MCQYPCDEIGQFALEDVEDYIATHTKKKYAFAGRQQSEDINKLADPLMINFNDFLQLVTPMNKDFAELML